MGTTKRKKMTQQTEDDDVWNDNTSPDEFGMYLDDTDTHPALQPMQLHPNGHASEPQRNNNSLGSVFFRKMSSKSRDRNPNRRATDGGFGSYNERHRRGSSYQFHARVGNHSQVAISIPMGPTMSAQNSLRKSRIGTKDSV